MSLDEAFGKALADKLLEDIPIYGVDGNSQRVIVSKYPSAAAMAASKFIETRSHLILDKIWDHIDLEHLASLVADLVVAKLLEEPQNQRGWGYQPNKYRDEIIKKTTEYVVAQLGQRAVDKLDIELTEKKPNEDV